MTAALDLLEAVHLELSGLTATAHAMPDRATLELFLEDGHLLYVCTSNRLEPPGLRAAWTVSRGGGAPVLVTVGTTAGEGAPLPVVTYRRRRRQVRGRVYRAGLFWIAEASGRRINVEVDNGLCAITANASRRAGPVRLRRSVTRLTRPIHPLQENL